jgi:hypothetical protein
MLTRRAAGRAQILSRAQLERDFEHWCHTLMLLEVKAARRHHRQP